MCFHSSNVNIRHTHTHTPPLITQRISSFLHTYNDHDSLCFGFHSRACAWDTEALKNTFKMGSITTNPKCRLAFFSGRMLSVYGGGCARSVYTTSVSMCFSMFFFQNFFFFYLNACFIHIIEVLFWFYFCIHMLAVSHYKTKVEKNQPKKAFFFLHFHYSLCMGRFIVFCEHNLLFSLRIVLDLFDSETKKWMVNTHEVIPKQPKC